MIDVGERLIWAAANTLRPLVKWLWCTYIGRLIGKEPKSLYTDQTLPSIPMDLTRMRQLIGPTKMDWHDGIRRMIQARHPEITLCQ
jgi:UDP-glucuronate 4-epimerase